MKMNNKGFTLIELLGVIVLLAVVTTIAVPSIMGISRNVKQNMLDAKIELLLEDAKMFGQDRMNTIVNSRLTVDINGNVYPCTRPQIYRLVSFGYVEAEDEECEIRDPRDNSCIRDEIVIIYLKNNRVVAIMANGEYNKDGNDYTCS